MDGSAKLVPWPTHQSFLQLEIAHSGALIAIEHRFLANVKARSKGE
jgi:hypothetical protein